ncbi:hypothetical protein ACEN2I_00360 [Flavobacterium sp. W22_SRS_FK3]|uniref:hypothetical protein n=1 Tax=Flavobacterium sp. W22_SRS_FK3 TaxID=3240275 RepID=UPI003F8E99DB
MKTICFLLIVCNFSFGQLKVNYYKVQNKFGETITDKTFFQKKLISDSETAFFSFSKKDSLLLDAHFVKSEGYFDVQFEELKNEFIGNFEPTKIKNWENLVGYYDEKKNIMIIKTFADYTRKKLTEIAFFTSNESIKGFLPLFYENFH